MNVLKKKIAEYICSLSNSSVSLASMYCIVDKKQTPNEGKTEYFLDAGGKAKMKAKCSSCGNWKQQFVSRATWDRKVKEYAPASGLSGGSGLDFVINRLPVEAHMINVSTKGIKRYQYCGPGTKLAMRLARGDPGINELDRGCKQHDIAYDKYQDTADRNRADGVLEKVAAKVINEKNAGFSEKIDARLVKGVMRGKQYFKV